MPKRKELTREEQKLFNELKKLSKRANQRIVRLEREFGKNTWATKYLKEKLEAEPLQAWTLKGRVKVNKSMTISQMENTIKATKQFLNSSISTKRGIQKAKAKAIRTLQVQYGSETEDITEEEAEALYNFFEDREVNRITNFIPGSTVIANIEFARENKYNYEDFASSLKSYQLYNKGNNIDDILRKIYVKYIFKGNRNINEVEILYNNIIELIDNASSENDIQEIESIISNLLSEKKIDSKEYNYLLNLLNDKRNEIL